MTDTFDTPFRDDPIVDPPVPNPLSPTVDDVAALIRARTKDSNGNEIGTFNADTRPTDTQAQEAIDHQLAELGAYVGRIGDKCSALAQQAVAWGAAAEIELSYFPEQVRRDFSPYPFLLTRYQALIAGLVDCVENNLPDAPDPDDPDLQSVRFGTIDCMSGTVAAFYTGRTWPPLPNPTPVEPPVIDPPVIEP